MEDQCKTKVFLRKGIEKHGKDGGILGSEKMKDNRDEYRYNA